MAESHPISRYQHGNIATELNKKTHGRPGASWPSKDITKATDDRTSNEDWDLMAWVYICDIDIIYVIHELLLYPLVMTNIAMERSTMLLIGKPSINGSSIPWLC